MKTKERNKMKKSLYLIRIIMILLAVAAFSQSCTKLDEKLYSEITPDNFFQNDAQFVSALGAAYTKLGNYASGEVYQLNELTTDEMVTPTRGSDWDDGGNWRRLHLHSWKFEDNAVGAAWDFGYTGINTANRLIYQVAQNVTKGLLAQATADVYVAELKSLRAFFYWQLVDLYGNVPLVTDFTSTDAAPANKTRLEVYNFIVGDLEASAPLLSKAVDGTTYGRMNYWAAKFLLAKLYLNAGVYTSVVDNSGSTVTAGTPQWTKAIAACNEIINSGKFSLESNYFTNFNVNDAGSKEFIFAIPYDQVFFQGFQMGTQTLHYANQGTYNFTQQPWNGFCTLEQFYNSYSDNDLRKGDAGTLAGPAKNRGNFIAGYQYLAAGGNAIDAGADGADPDGTKLNLGSIGDGVPQINSLGPQCWRQSGVRIGKWEFAQGSDPGNLSNDLAVFRYADVLLMKAEAQWRNTGDAADGTSLALVNQIRERAGLTDLSSLDGKLSFDLAASVVPGGELFNEMGREMFAEHNRRQDLIRWGFFNNNDKWVLPFANAGDVLKTTGDYLRVFPIGKSKLAANPNLKQNPKY
jgi:starch-binding outer membrane protein, SusD/RagB family